MFYGRIFPRVLVPRLVLVVRSVYTMCDFITDDGDRPTDIHTNRLGLVQYGRDLLCDLFPRKYSRRGGARLDPWFLFHMYVSIYIYMYIYWVRIFKVSASPLDCVVARWINYREPLWCCMYRVFIWCRCFSVHNDSKRVKYIFSFSPIGSSGPKLEVSCLGSFCLMLGYGGEQYSHSLVSVGLFLLSTD